MLSFTAPRSATPRVATDTHYLTQMWREACAELSFPDGDDTVAHDVEICLEQGAHGGMQTKYSVAHDASVQSRFLVERRFRRPTLQEVTVWGRQFADVAAVTTTDQQAVAGYFTPERRSMVVQLLQRFPTAQISNDEVCLRAKGSDPHRPKAVSNLAQLLSAATIMQPAWTDVLLDERSVMQDLFGFDRDVAGVSRRFEELYRGNVVRWTGEVLQVGEGGGRERWAAILVGSADGRSTASGRVVAMSAIDPKSDMDPGDVVSFEGMLVHLDAPKRFFRLA